MNCGLSWEQDRSNVLSVLLSLPKFQRLEIVRKAVIEEWNDSRLPTYPYTPHNAMHCQKVEELIFELIPLDRFNKLDENEKFLLFSSAWLHDIGMIPDLFSEEKEKRNEFHGNEAALADYNMSIRNQHAKRSADYVERNYKKLNLSPMEKKYIKKLCNLHRQKAYRELESEPWISEDFIRVPLLAAYLRLADALHIPRKEEGTLLIYMILGLDSISKLHWFKSKYVSDVIINPEDFAITVKLKKPKKENGQRYEILDWESRLNPLKETLLRMIQDELDPLKDILAKGGLSIYLNINFDAVEDVNLTSQEARELRELLNNLELLDPTFSPNASAVIETVFKQIELIIELDNPQISVRYLKDYIDKNLDDFLRSRPCHVFLHDLAIDVNKILNSNKKDDEKVAEIKEKIKDIRKKRCEARNNIAIHAYSEVFNNDGPILLYGYSDTIIASLDFYLKNKNNIEVYICEGRTKTIYRYNNRLVYSDGLKYAHELKRIERKHNEKKREEIIEMMCSAFQDKSISKDNFDENNLRNLDEQIRNEFLKKWNEERREIKIHYVTDSCVSNIFSRGKIKKVLFGANGIDKNEGWVAHTLGHLAIADIAEPYKIPVYILTDTMKIGDLGEHKKEEIKDLQRSNQWLTTDVKFEPILDELINYNPKEDIVPIDKIFRFVTEQGIILPQNIGKCVSNNQNGGQ